jgi:hypothetical protein
MTGADAPALRALAAQLSQSAGRLDGIRQGIRSRLYSVHWDGPDGANFRRMWDGQHVPLLAGVAEGLRDSAERLLAEADQQEAASGSGAAGGGQSMGPTTGRISVPEEDEERDPISDLGLAVKGLTIAVGGFGTFFERMVRGFGNQVSGHFRADGSWVDGYTRWNAGHAASLNGHWLLGRAGDVAARADDLSRLGNGLSILGAGFDGYGQWKEDDEYATGERITRAAGGAVASGLIGLAAERGGIWAGAALGTALIPIPGVGTVVGGLVGWAVAAGVTTLLEDQITDLGAAVGSVAYDVGEAVVDFGSDVLDAGGELLGDIGEGAEELWEDLTPW